MVNPNRFYTYAYLREDRTPYYIGKGQGNRVYKKHQKGISVPKDKSRIIFLKQNLTEAEAFRHEIYMIAVFGRKDLGTGILHNRTAGGDGSSGMVHSEETKDKIRESGKKVGKRNYELGIGFHSLTTEERKKNGSRNGKMQYENKIGLFSISPEETLENAKKGGKKASELGLGIHSLTSGQRAENGKIGGKIAGRKNYQNKTACFSITPEQRVEINKKTNSQKWMCLETEFVTTAGPLTRYQRKRGIDTSKRKRIA